MPVGHRGPLQLGGRLKAVRNAHATLELQRGNSEQKQWTTTRSDPSVVAREGKTGPWLSRCCAGSAWHAHALGRLHLDLPTPVSRRNTPASGRRDGLTYSHSTCSTDDLCSVMMLPECRNEVGRTRTWPMTVRVQRTQEVAPAGADRRSQRCCARSCRAWRPAPCTSPAARPARPRSWPAGGPTRQPELLPARRR